MSFARKLDRRHAGQGLSDEFAEAVFHQIRGFGEYGFPESHAASFALLVYVSAWLKCHYPAAFCAALLNSQPMGFYAPAQLVRDAQEHGVEVRPIDVNDSRWDCTLEDGRRSAGAADDRRLAAIASHANRAAATISVYGRTPTCIARLGHRPLGPSRCIRLAETESPGFLVAGAGPLPYTEHATAIRSFAGWRVFG